jgi:hypothetical protein
MSELWDEWEECRDMVHVNGKRLAASVSATSRVLTNGQVKLSLFFSQVLTEQFAKPTVCHVRASPSDGGQPMLRIEFGRGDIAVTFMGDKLKSCRTHFKAPPWLPARDSIKHWLQIVRQDSAGLTLAFDLKQWGAPEPLVKTPAAKAQGTAPPPAPAEAGVPITGAGLTIILKRAGYQAERVSETSWSVDDEKVTAAQAVALANAWRAKNGAGPISVAVRG